MEIKEKECFKCNVVKPLTEFYKHVKNADGHLNKCKTCTKTDSKNRLERLQDDEKWHEKEKNRNREKYHRLEYRSKYKPTTDRKKETLKKYHQKYPEKCLATKYTEIFLTKEAGYHLHHWSYNQEHWLDIIKLTIKEHHFLHRYIIYDSERMMYRNLNGILLDTRESHMEYYEECKQKYPF